MTGDPYGYASGNPIMLSDPTGLSAATFSPGQYAALAALAAQVAALGPAAGAAGAAAAPYVAAAALAAGAGYGLGVLACKLFCPAIPSEAELAALDASTAYYAAINALRRALFAAQQATPDDSGKAGEAPSPDTECSANQINQEIESRKAPKGINRVDRGNPNIPGNPDHVHLDGSGARSTGTEQLGTEGCQS